MYFRFPILLLFIFACIGGLLFLQAEFGKRPSEVNGHPMVPNEPRDRLVTKGEPIDTIDPHDLRAHVEFLADDLLEGRDTGSRGARIAAKYITSQFERVGLEPVGDDESYLQAVSFVRQSASASSVFNVEIDGEMVPLEYGRDFVVTGMPMVSGQLQTLEAVFAGFGVKAEEYNYDDYDGLDASGRAVIYVGGEPKSDDETYFKGESATPYSGITRKLSNAEKSGASLAIRVVGKEKLQGYTWDTVSKYYLTPRMRLKASQPSTNSFVSIAVSPEAAEILFAGEEQSYAQIAAGAVQGALTTFDLKKKIQIRIDFDHQETQDNNVVGYLPGSDPEIKSEVVVFTAHYDHIGVGTPVAGDSIYNGAADNASGVAGLLELAEAFSAMAVPPRRSLLFLALTAEEKGLLGSRFYVENPIFPLSQTAANFNLDMIGIMDTTALVVYGIERSTLGDDIRAAAEQVGLEILPDDMPEEHVFYRSDHYNFARMGVPAIFPSFGIDQSHKNDMMKFYHQRGDDINLSWLNYKYMKRHVQVVFLASLAVANANDMPTWTPGDEFEKVRAKSQQKTLTTNGKE